MPEKARMSKLIAMAANGDQKAMNELVQRFIPIIKKYSRQIGYDEACSDLILWMIGAVYRYHPNTTWGKDELKQYLTRKDYPA